MATGSTTSSRVSLVSLDPAVASQITGPTTLATSQPGKSRTGSSFAKSSRNANSSSQDQTRTKSRPNKSATVRSNSLKRVKNSTEVLRDRSAQPNKRKKKRDDATADARGGRNFTIGNVGTGGVLYLRPSKNRSPLQSPPYQASVPSIPLADSSNIKQQQQQLDAQSKRPLPDNIESIIPKPSLPGQGNRPNTKKAPHQHARSQSFSTVEEHRKSVSNSKSKTLKIVIHRPDNSRSKTSFEQDEQSLRNPLPSLHVPIPHYRIGTPRFSTHGTALLRSSAYTQFSAAPAAAGRSNQSSQLELPIPSSPRSALKSPTKIEPERSGAVRSTTTPQIPKSPMSRSSASTSKSQSTLREQIRPEIFDELSAIYNDPAIVRYSPNGKEITAASPARIIAQISSESFMDYELVSDFFLTFRLYMSTATVLDYLLARLRWAIDRLEEDGRIIRVRTFAALRHWILNYFLDDFAVDRRIRVRFCSQINQMYAEVKIRPGNGTSDLKVLRDLKRCWNGRCLLFWDPVDFPVDGEQDADIQPGGLIQIPDMDGSLVDLEEIERPAPLQIARERPTREDITSNEPAHQAAPQTVHERQDSTNSTGPQESIDSSGSLQPLSCSIPVALSRANGDAPPRTKGPHPVSVPLRGSRGSKGSSKPNLLTKLSPHLQPNNHKRGARSIDSNRAPTPNGPKAPMHLLPDNGSLARGLIYQPSTPLVHVTPLPATLSTGMNGLQVIDNKINYSPSTGAAPGVKNIFGSLRKALGSRPGQSDMALTTISAPLQDHSLKTQRSPMPLNVSRSHDELQKKTAPAPMKGVIRIDLLCAAVGQNFESAFPSASHGRRISEELEEQPDRSADPKQHNHPAENFNEVRSISASAKRSRLASHTTAQSGSILIVDDTGFDMPLMSGALRSSMPEAANWQAGSSGPWHAPFGIRSDIRRRESSDFPVTQRSSGVLGGDMHSPVLPTAEEMEANQLPKIDPRHIMTDKNVRTSADHIVTIPAYDTPTTLHDPGSDRSSTSSVGPTATSVSSPVVEQEHPPEAVVPSHTLRRRPGGDLRKAENVHELDHAIQHESIDTTSIRSRSPNESLLVMNDGTTNKTKQQNPGGKPKNVSMINTHSSQHLRPSFEAVVVGFSAIPDDDDGGLEATLSKLEGRYEKRSPPLEQHPLDTGEKRRSMPNISLQDPVYADEDQSQPIENLRGYKHEPSRDTRVELEHVNNLDDLAQLDQDYSTSKKSSIFGLTPDFMVRSRESYNSQPLLNRDTSNTMSNKPVSDEGTRSMSPDLNRRPKNIADPDQQDAVLAQNKDSLLKPVNSILRPETSNESAQSFLLDADENLSDLSSEISVDIINYSEVMDRSLSPMIAAPGTAISGLEIPSHPLTYASVINLGMNAEDFNHISAFPEQSRFDDYLGFQHVEDKKNSSKREHGTSRISGGPAHIPFILVCDSQALAQQMTLIEKSALSEIEWSDLVEMRWDTSSTAVLDWAEYLSKGDLRGINLVITRFNLMVKWALSEIVLTQDIRERAQVITKYIHIAAHARRLHNYATMLQITIALTSMDCIRLKRTWELVSDPDKSLLKNMEVLVQPVRNFHELRQEMESADLRGGCIPFIGLYVHDLTYNAQKPSLIASRNGGEPLINFERYSTAALIVKGLLRLIDASSRYEFSPVEGVIERCLWLATLRDDRIRSISNALEA